MRWSRAKNSAVSSSIDFEGGFGGKGITSDISRTSLGYTPRCQPFSRQLAHFCGEMRYFVAGLAALPLDIKLPDEVATAEFRR